MEDIPLGFILILFGFVAAIVLTAIVIVWKQRRLQRLKDPHKDYYRKKGIAGFSDLFQVRPHAKRAIFYVSVRKSDCFCKFARLYAVMKRIFATLIFALPLLFCGCSEEEDILPEQRQKIVSYLERTHSPALIPESQVETGSQQRFYTMSGSTVYRYIDNFYRDGRSELPEVTAAAKATITFRAYVFAFSNITDSTFPFYSNDPALQQAYEDMGLTPGAWSFEPLTLDMRGDILNGLRHALLGCREGDIVEAYMTYNMAYGDKYVSTIPRESPVAWFFTVESVEYDE